MAAKPAPISGEGTGTPANAGPDTMTALANKASLSFMTNLLHPGRSDSDAMNRHNGASGFGQLARRRAERLERPDRGPAVRLACRDRAGPAPRLPRVVDIWTDRYQLRTVPCGRRR